MNRLFVAALFAATAPAGTAAAQRTPPHLELDVNALIDIIVTAPAEKVEPEYQIVQTVYSPPVSLSDVTDGLVSGSVENTDRKAGDAAEVQAALDRAVRQLRGPR